MSNENSIQRLKEQLQMICNKIENILLEFKEIKEKNSKLKTNQTFFNDLNSKINSINKFKQKITSLQNSLENIYNIGNINKIESEIKKKIILIKKLSDESNLLSNLIKNQKKDIDDYSSKFKENKEISEMRNKLNFAKEENHLKKESYTVLNAKVKGQMSKIDILEKQMNIIKQNIEYQKNKQKKEVEKSLNFEEDETEENYKNNLDNYLITEKMLISEIGEEEKNFQNEIYQQNQIIQNLKEKINQLYEYKNQLKKEGKIKKIKLLKYKSNEKDKTVKNFGNKYKTSGKSLDYKVQINNIKKFSYKPGESPKNSTQLNNINIKVNNRPFNAIKFNEIYKNINQQNYRNKNKNNDNIYSSFYENSLQSNKNEKTIENKKQKKRSKISNDIEKLRNEIEFTLKNNVVFFNSPSNAKYDKNILNEEKNYVVDKNSEINYKNNNKPFEKFNFS
jgi:hypothetical protein